MYEQLDILLMHYRLVPLNIPDVHDIIHTILSYSTFMNGQRDEPSISQIAGLNVSLNAEQD